MNYLPQVHGDKMLQALTMDVLATDLADYLVRKGVSYIYVVDVNTFLTAQ